MTALLTCLFIEAYGSGIGTCKKQNGNNCNSSWRSLNVCSSDATVFPPHSCLCRDIANDVELGWEVEGIITPEESIRMMIPVIEGKGLGDSGTFWTWEDKVNKSMLLHDKL